MHSIYETYTLDGSGSRSFGWEDRQYIARFGGRWKLTDSNPYDNGVTLAFLAWGTTESFMHYWVNYWV